jgi:hypothetical protein
MKRSHRQCLRWIWPLLLLLSAAVVGLALAAHPAVLQNPDWPPALTRSST